MADKSKGKKTISKTKTADKSKAKSKAKTKNPEAKKDYRIGHRDRLRKRFLKLGADGLEEYEILELLLYRLLPRRDTKAIAHELIDKFGDLSAVLTTDTRELVKVKFITENIVTEFRLSEAIALKIGQSKIMGGELLANWDNIISYVRTKFAEAKTENLHAIFLSKQNRVIADEVLSKGTIDHTPIYPREIVARALELQAGGLVLIHNHPSGDTRPSESDIKITHELFAHAASMNITLHDHIIVGRGGETSFKSLNLLKGSKNSI